MRILLIISVLFFVSCSTTRKGTVIERMCPVPNGNGASLYYPTLILPIGTITETPIGCHPIMSKCKVSGVIITNGTGMSSDGVTLIGSRVFVCDTNKIKKDTSIKVLVIQQ